ncbi:Alkaline phosphatase synthesis transcriptional regulatory protein PhoP [Dyadobacter sp. CECT 9275]|uniref:Alkaline phosphatase synthesis transcriptional regulatory protein PhoP n=1 Tax=Dyadobacter helix TaxID=2822344 RepID=A0A916JAR2_9BACT|nr:response regulator transcription factor [Dyadobacter sp. CECT 9275]CAG4999007.1 Alkaline phosphatase synthesis transcriptional regulatory protein PhoP [Dyadobacter sp. CECT 9275]
MDLKKSILVIDDEPSICKILEHFLKNDFNVVVKNDGSEGMIWLEQGNSPDLIIADLQMPNLNGKEFLKIAKASNIYADIPVIILSGSDDSSERIQCLNLGADDFMLKPFNPMEVHAKINAVLRRNARYS